MNKNFDNCLTVRCLKYSSLILLTLQNSAVFLSMRHVRSRPGKMFVSGTAVVMSEVFKLFISLLMIFITENKFFTHLYEHLIEQPMDCLKATVPGVLYLVLNNLLFIAASNLNAATFQVTYQLKLLTTALMSVLMLRRSLNCTQWTSLLVLFSGVAITQLSPDTPKVHVTSAPSLSPPSTTISYISASKNDPVIGFVAVGAACMLSGFTSVYVEKLMKHTDQSLWIRNVQLSVVAIIVGLLALAFTDSQTLLENGFFVGYDAWVWFVVALSSFGGLCVATVVKYADNILKGFSTSLAIVISCAASVYFFNTHLNLRFLAGTSLVIGSVFAYSYAQSRSLAVSVSKAESDSSVVEVNTTMSTTNRTVNEKEKEFLLSIEDETPKNTE